ncbi:6252_t:CDS:2, partial [Acaulospora colombiana]
MGVYVGDKVPHNKLLLKRFNNWKNESLDVLKLDISITALTPRQQYVLRHPSRDEDSAADGSHLFVIQRGLHSRNPNSKIPILEKDIKISLLVSPSLTKAILLYFSYPPQILSPKRKRAKEWWSVPVSANNRPGNCVLTHSNSPLPSQQSAQIMQQLMPDNDIVSLNVSNANHYFDLVQNKNLSDGMFPDNSTNSSLKTAWGDKTSLQIHPPHIRSPNPYSSSHITLFDPSNSKSLANPIIPSTLNLEDLSYAINDTSHRISPHANIQTNHLSVNASPTISDPQSLCLSDNGTCVSECYTSPHISDKKRGYESESATADSRKQRKLHSVHQELANLFNESFFPMCDVPHLEVPDPSPGISLKLDRTEFFRHMNRRLDYMALSIKRSLRYPYDYDDLSNWRKLYKLFKGECLQVKNLLDASEFRSMGSLKSARGHQFTQEDVDKDLLNLIPGHAILQNPHPLKVKKDGNEGFRSITLLLRSSAGESFHEELRVRTVLEMVYPDYFQKDTLEMLSRFKCLTQNAPDYPIQMWQIEALNTGIDTSNIGVPQFFILSRLLKARIHVVHPDPKNPYFKEPVPGDKITINSRIFHLLLYNPQTFGDNSHALLDNYGVAPLVEPDEIFRIPDVGRITGD